MEGLPDAHGLISGPPCPPWSKIGSKRAWGDKRAAVFLTVLKWIFHLAGRRDSVFTFSVLENVDGMRSRSGKQKDLLRTQSCASCGTVCPADGIYRFCHAIRTALLNRGNGCTSWDTAANVLSPCPDCLR